MARITGLIAPAGAGAEEQEAERMTWRMRDDRTRSADAMAPFEHLMYRTESVREARSTMVAVYLLDRAPDWERVVDIHERTSRQFLRLRQRVVEPAVPVGSPRWVVDPDFDLTYHLRRIGAPGPGTGRELLDLAETAMMAPLDPARPLWEATVVEGLADGRAALIQKVNHAVTDGLGGVQLMSLLFETARDSVPTAMPALPVPADLTPADLARSALVELPGNVVRGGRTGAARLWRTAAQTIRAPRATADGAIGFVQSLRRVVGSPPVEPSPLLRSRGLSRRLEVVELPLASLRAAAKVAGASVNDAYLAAVGGVLRRYHDALGVPVDAVPAAVPISLRVDDDPIGGNRWAGARLPLPTEPTDPAQRMQLVRALMLNARAEPAIDALNALAPVLSRSPSGVLTMMSSLARGTDVQLSNIPGPTSTLYFAGAEVLKQFPFGPLPGPAMMITMFSLAGTCHVGITYDPAAVTDQASFRQALREGFDEVVGAGTTELPIASRSDAMMWKGEHDDDRTLGGASATDPRSPAAGNGGGDRGPSGGPVDGRILRL